MKILHISDLHLTGENESFDDVWDGPRAAIGDQRFDLIVVSGDLSQRAGDDEYAALFAFANETLLPMLRDGIKEADRRRRVVFVPGNHDVDWKQPIGSVFSVTDRIDREGPEAVRASLRKARLHPELSDVREIVGPFGQSEFLTLDRDAYPKRFKSVQAFFDRFYRSTLKDPDHRFKLTGAPSDQWSAHLFRDEGVAIYGFNSCHRNDRYWTGASFSSAAVNEAARHAETHARELLRVAVWHHGLGSDRGRPDRITVRDLGLLYNAGFRVGLHGHTHAGEGDDLRRMLGAGFAIVSTGSLGAHAAERPDAVGNQFSILRLQWSQVDAELWQREGAAGIYKPARRFFFMVRDEPRAPEQVSRARTHSRTWRVDRHGILHATVVLEDLALHSDVVLAVVHPPFCDARGAAKARVPEGELAVEEHRLPNGGRRYSLRPDGRTYARLEWTYEVSNAVALTQTERARRSPDAGPRSPLPLHESRPYTVRFPCDQLTLSLRFETPDVIAPGSRAGAVVETRHEDHGLEGWRRFPQAEARCHLDDPTPDGAVVMRVENPLVGYRYAIEFALAQQGLSLDTSTRRLATELMEKCRESHRRDGSLDARITDQLSTQIERLLGGPLGPRSAWLGLLWAEARNQLFVAFGRFLHPSWNVRFKTGDGVAGHAFRFARPVTWHCDDGGTAPLIYRPETEAQGPYRRAYRWVVSVPLGARDGSPIGAVSLAADREDTDADRRLDALAADPAKYARFLGELHAVLNVTFWALVADAEELLPIDRSHAQSILDAWTR